MNFPLPSNINHEVKESHLSFIFGVPSILASSCGKKLKHVCSVCFCENTHTTSSQTYGTRTRVLHMHMNIQPPLAKKNANLRKPSTNHAPYSLRQGHFISCVERVLNGCTLRGMMG